MLLIARTDAESARLISSTIDARDHPYIQGVRTCLPDGSRRPSLAEVLDRAEAEGRSGTEIDNLETKWFSKVELTTFDEGKVAMFLFYEAVLSFGRTLTNFFGVGSSCRANGSGVECHPLTAKGICS
jgi:isocitrate lyase